MRLLGTVPASEMKSAANVFRKGDVLYGRLRSYLNKVYQPDFCGLCSGEFIVLPESPEVSGSFLKYRLNAMDFVAFASHINTGDRPRVDFDQIKAFEFLLPPIREQQRISDALDELLSDLDAGVEALQRAQAKLALYRASVLKAAVQGDLTAEWRKQHPDAEPAPVLLQRILLERRQRWEQEQLRKFKAAGKTSPANWKAKYKEPVAADTTNLPPLPEGWCWASLDQMCLQITDGEHIQPRYQPTGKPMLSAKNVRDGFMSFDDIDLIAPADFESCMKRCAPKENDVLVVSVGATTGRAAIVGPCEPFSIVRSVLLLRPVIHSKFILRWVQSPKCQEHIRLASGSTAQAHLYINDTRNLPIPLAPLAEIGSIVDEVDDQFSVIEHLQIDIESRLKRCSSLRQSILRHAFTGQLVPQDPKDEPASELLKRIAAEREARKKTKATPRKQTAKRQKREK